MKRNIINLLCFLILITGCTVFDINDKKESNDINENRTLTDELVISYRSGDVSNKEDGPFYEIKLYADKYITLGYSHLDGFVEGTLADSQLLIM